MDPTLESSFPVYHRWLPGDEAPYGVMHVVDRVVGREFLLGEVEKEKFRIRSYFRPTRPLPPRQ